MAANIDQPKINVKLAPPYSRVFQFSLSLEMLDANYRHSRESGNPNPGVPGAVGLSGHDAGAGCFHSGSPQVPRGLLLAKADGGLDSRFRGNDG